MSDEAIEDIFADFDDVDVEEETVDDTRRPQVLPPPSHPLPCAKAFIEPYRKAGLLTLRNWHDGWWAWRTTHWAEIREAHVRSLLYGFTEFARYQDEKRPTTSSLKPWAPNRKKIGDLVEALASVCYTPDETDQPSWFSGQGPTGSIVSVANGLLDVDRRVLLSHTPDYFNQTSVPFDYDKDAPRPDKWLAFLDQLLPGDTAAIDALGEWFGYVISGRTDLHKIMLMVGPTRGGKGIIARILAALIGRKNTCGPTLNSFSGEFGLQTLIGKPLALISDARFARRDASIVIERLLSISGEDILSINRKNRDYWTGKLPTRIHILSNELPQLGDASGAIVGRVILLQLTESWLGKEDHELEQRLQAELPGILNFALDGLQRLTTVNGNRFTRVASADESISTMEELASPVRTFVRQRCQVAGKLSINKDLLFETYRLWAEKNGVPKKDYAVFARDLRSAFPMVKASRPTDPETGQRTHLFVGINLRAEDDR
jgi:putative DNA primase/helicase